MKTGHNIFSDVGSVAFMNASPEVCARRRCIERDKHRSRSTPLVHSTRNAIPLSIPEGAIYLDTSDMTEDEVLKYILDHVKAALSE